MRALTRPFASARSNFARAKGAFTNCSSFIDIIEAARRAYSQCVEFTGGLELEEFARAVDSALADFVASQKVKVEEVSVATSDEERVQDALNQLYSTSEILGTIDAYVCDELRSSLIRDASYALAGAAGPVDLEAPFALWVSHCASTKSHASSLSRLLSACESLPSSSVAVAPQTHERSENIVKTLQMGVYEAMFAPIRVQLDSVPSLPVWEASDGGDISFGGPSAYASSVGEQLLMLVQHLEPFASASGDNRVSMHAVARLLNLGLRKNISAMIQSDVTMITKEESTGEADAFTDSWLFAVSEGAALYFVLKILNIPKLGRIGATQLLADLNYIVNVVQAVGYRAGHTLTDFQFAVENMHGDATEEESGNASRKRILLRMRGKNM